MNARQLADYLRIHVNTAKVMLRDGRIKGTKTVKGWEITQEAVNNYLKKYEK